MGLPYDAVLCDFDGVVRHYDAGEVTALERACGLAEGTTMKIALAPERLDPVTRGQITTARWMTSIVAELERLLGSAEQAGALGRAFAEARVRVDEEVLGLLRRAQARVPVVLVTNATAQLEDDLQTLGLTYAFDDVVSSARVGAAKPERRIYEIAAERAGATAARCLFVDDRRENVEAARALGMTGVFYREVADLREALAPLLDGGRGPSPS
ncbi:haloacid dehalogenase [Planomonospora parontospora subsp. parontospora]|uniref:Haloacid dehalogenase n=2 Tax=Planomonospora parontospora TaxID=58119 RepID=A0AA37BF36_9ACTN|nr:HAD-IA family hydrolase [Planomonospora parontospora]GGK60837.1 haloacid dehalogenase [Planomonospora parontospora]GII08732.1 haloacid dehalogenase [Planomonospora parontospora subsp. parontospora]